MMASWGESLISGLGGTIPGQGRCWIPVSPSSFLPSSLHPTPGLPFHRISFKSPLRVCVLSRFSRVLLFATPWTEAHQPPLSMGFSRQGHWCRLPFPSPGDLPNPGIKPGSPALQVDSLLSEQPGKLYHIVNFISLILCLCKDRLSISIQVLHKIF